MPSTPVCATAGSSSHPPFIRGGRRRPFRLPWSAPRAPPPRTRPTTSASRRPPTLGFLSHPWHRTCAPHPGAPVAPAHGPSRVSTACRSRCARICRTTRDSVTNPRMRASPQQRGHTSTSALNTSRNSSAQRRRRARSAGQLSSCTAASGGSSLARTSTTPRGRHHARRCLAKPLSATPTASRRVRPRPPTSPRAPCAGRGSPARASSRASRERGAAPKPPPQTP